LLAALAYFLGIEFLRFVKAPLSAWRFDATLPPTLKKRGRGSLHLDCRVARQR
jgi:hypothetical protein